MLWHRTGFEIAARTFLAGLMALSVVLTVSISPAFAQDEQPPTTEPPAEEPAPPVTPVPGDPLVNEGASDELDPNTPDEPLDGESPETAPTDSDDAEETCEPEEPAAEGEEAEPCTPKKRGRYANQPAFVPDSLNRGELRRVERELDAARAEHVTNVAEVRSLRLTDKRLMIERDELSAETVETLALLEETEEQLRRRALASFVQGDSFELAGSLEHDEILRHQQQQFLVGEVFALDQDLLDQYTRLREQLERESLNLYDRMAAVRRWLREADEKAQETAAEVERLEFERATWENRSATWIEDVVWPIDGRYELPLINSWGYPRAPGSIDEHWHEGIDIFAPEGETLVAAEGGVVTDIGVGTLGGLKIWILGNSGTRWYYAHLMAFNPDLKVGDQVLAGSFIGYVGKTGNAISTPPHLHLQMHPDGGRPVNPFPILQAASDRYQAGIRPDGLESSAELGADGTRLLPNGLTQGQVDAGLTGQTEQQSDEDPVRVDGALPAPDELDDDALVDDAVADGSEADAPVVPDGIQTSGRVLPR